MLRSAKILITQIFILAAAFAGCNRSEDHSEILIYGGEPVASSDWRPVVAVTGRSGDGSHFIECSGTLFSPRHVLTAGHCVDRPDLISNDPAALANVGIYIGSGAEGGKVEGVLAVKKISVHADLRIHPGGNADIAVIELSEEVTSLKPVQLVASIDLQQRTLTQDKEVKLIGYGRREDGGRGLKFMADAKAREILSWESVAGSDGKDSCEGDSGGPVFLKDPGNNWMQYAIVSRGWTFECGKGGYLTNIAPHACWIAGVSGVRFPGTWTQCKEAKINYSEAELSAISFLQLCRGKSANQFQKETLRRLKQNFNTTNCRELASILSSETLKLDHLQLRDLSPLAPFTQLHYLSLSGNLVNDPSVLLRFTALKHLSIEANNIDNPAKKLAALAINGTRITGNRSQLNNYARTEFAALCGQNDLSDGINLTIKSIFAKTMAEDCKTANIRLLMMKTLRLSDRGLTDLTPLAALPSVVTLDLSDNPISDISALAGMENLRNLTIKNTQVTDLSPLADLVSQGLIIKQ